MPLLEAADLSVAFGNRRAIDGLTLALEAGERVGIIGESGSGKTTLALALAGLLPRGARLTGTLSFAGASYPQTEKALATWRGKNLAYLRADPGGLDPMRRLSAQAPPKLLAELGVDRVYRLAHELTPQDRILGLAAIALAQDPTLLIADDLLRGLDVLAARRVVDIIGQRPGRALLLLSHDIKAVAMLCDRVLVLRAGKIVEAGLTRYVLSVPRNEHARRLIETARLKPRPLMKKPLGEVVIAVRGLTGPGVRGAGFELRSAESLALLGRHGSGATALAQLLAGRTAATSGEATFGGVHYRNRAITPALRREVLLLPSSPGDGFDLRQTVAAVLDDAMPGQPREARRGRSAAAIAAVGLRRELAQYRVGELPVEHRQRLAFARAIVRQPRLVVIDEPLRCLDIAGRGRLLALLNRLRADLGLTLCVATSDPDVALLLCDKALVLEGGSIVEGGKVADVVNHPQNAASRALAEARLPDVGLG